MYYDLTRHFNNSERELKEWVSNLIWNKFSTSNITIQDVFVSYSGYQLNSGNFKITVTVYTDEGLFQFSLLTFPNNQAILISTNTQVAGNLRNRGIAQKLQEVKFEIAKKLECSLILCTVESSNIVEQHILEKFGWKEISTFKSRSFDLSEINEDKLYIKSISW